MCKIYWFTGQPGAGKTTLGRMLVDLLDSENQKVFHIDGDDLRELTDNKDYSKNGRITNIRNAQMMAEYLYKKNYNVVASLVSPYLEIREELKKKIGKDLIEFYIHTSEKREKDEYKTNEYEQPIENYIDIDTTNETASKSFQKIIICKQSI